MAGIVAILAAVLALTVAIGPWLLTFGLVQSPVSGLSSLKVADDATLSVAGAIMLLAIFTALLAFYTSGSVAEGRKERFVSERAMEASWRPILVDVPAGMYVQDAGAAGTQDLGAVMVHRVGSPKRALRPIVPFRNIGSGVAIITSAGLRVGELAWSDADISSPILPPGELTTVSFEIPMGREDAAGLIEALGKVGPNRPTWRVLVGYGDQSGTKTWLVEAHIAPKEERNWFVRQISLHDGKSGRLIVMSGPRQADGVSIP